MTKLQRVYLTSAIISLCDGINHSIMSNTMFNCGNENMACRIAEMSQSEFNDAKSILKEFIECEE